MCDDCVCADRCPFYEAGADECVYEVLAKTVTKMVTPDHN